MADSGGDILFALGEEPEYFQILFPTFELLHAQKNRRRPAALGNNDRVSRLPNLFEKGRRALPEIRYGDYLGYSCHQKLQLSR